MPWYPRLSRGDELPVLQSLAGWPFEGQLSGEASLTHRPNYSAYWRMHASVKGCKMPALER